MISSLLALFRPRKERKSVSEEIASLRAMVISLAQDVMVLKDLLREKNLWDAATYKRIRTKVMIDDHNAAGPAPWVSHSYYRYTLKELDYLRLVFNANDHEIQEYENKVDFVSRLT
ncbi:MAG: hypothetical protein V3T77_09700 [Planctomycetota bacterium]